MFCVKRISTVIIILCTLGNNLHAQRNMLIKASINPFEMVHVDDSVRTKLYSFLWKERKDSLKAGISIYHILGKDKVNNYQFVEGVYSFRMMGPHFLPYYFIYTKTEGVEIIRFYDLENLLSQVVQCFKRNIGSFSETDRIAYIQSMIKDLNLRNRYNGNELLIKDKAKNGKKDFLLKKESKPE